MNPIVKQQGKPQSKTFVINIFLKVGLSHFMSVFEFKTLLSQNWKRKVFGFPRNNYNLCKYLTY